NTPDGSDSATIAHMECGDAETRADCGRPATDPSASSQPVPARSAAAEAMQPPNKGKFSLEVKIHIARCFVCMLIFYLEGGDNVPHGTDSFVRGLLCALFLACICTLIRPYCSPA
ncbi:unnamed protein product, partial [Sphacelaria rigidula]